MSQFSLDIFLYAKNTQNYRENRVARATVFFNESATGYYIASAGGEKGR